MGINWTLGIGDPTAMGWVTVAAYFGAGLLCAGAAAKAKPYSANAKSNSLSDRRFWLSAFCILIILGVNKQIDLQSLFTDLARAAAKAQDWYGERRRYQVGFIGVLGLAGVLIFSSLSWRLRRSPAPVKLALLGIAFICLFVLVRAASFHHIDYWLGTHVASMRWNWIIELSGIATVAIAAARYKPRINPKRTVALRS